jgi:hypothetical protein
MNAAYKAYRASMSGLEYIHVQVQGKPNLPKLGTGSTRSAATVCERIVVNVQTILFALIKEMPIAISGATTRQQDPKLYIVYNSLTIIVYNSLTKHCNT